MRFYKVDFEPLGWRVSCREGASLLEAAWRAGIPREDVIIDCLALTVGADHRAALVTLEAVRLVVRELGVNQTLGASNVSSGLPNKHYRRRRGSFATLSRT